MADNNIVTADSLAKRVVATREQCKDFRTYQRLTEEAKAHGVQLEIVSDDEYRTMTGAPEPEPAPEPDEDGVITDPDGTRHLLVTAEQTADFPSFVRLSERARQLNAEMRFVAD